MINEKKVEGLMEELFQRVEVLELKIEAMEVDARKEQIRNDALRGG